MKKIIISLIVVFTATTVFAQTQANKDSIASSTTTENVAVYKLFPTTNTWTFIKLNTRTGQMWQVQYSIKGEDYRFETYLNRRPLVSEEEEVNGRFALYSTTNIYNFILLDQIDGRVWQVQWSQDAENRMIVPIE